MAKEWILNSATNRFQLNFKKNVGATSEEIRKCAPKGKWQWEEYYYKNVRTKEHLEELGRTLYQKIDEVLKEEISEITEEDCINFIKELVIDRTYEGYEREINTIFNQLIDELKTEIYYAPDEWDRTYNVDYYIDVNGKYIGLQIKPVPEGNIAAIPEVHKEHNIQRATFEQFTEKYGGKVFYIYSKKGTGSESDKKVISNIEVINEIKQEMIRLGG